MSGSGVKPVSAGEQLVVELYTRDLRHSLGYYQRLGFEAVRVEQDFAVLRWGENQLFLDERADAAAPFTREVGNIRVMAPDVNRCWGLVQQLGLPVLNPIADRYYGLRDFTVAGPDGMGIRFASRL
jgi:catechol 2,3-dioxygenase-like lactoylglutathione lyase family enzyme